MKDSNSQADFGSDIPLADEDEGEIVMGLQNGTSSVSGNNKVFGDNIHDADDMNEAEEKAKLIAQVLELQNTLDDLSQRQKKEKLRNKKKEFLKEKRVFFRHDITRSIPTPRVDNVKEESFKLRSENQVLGQYIQNLMAASSVFQSTGQPGKKS